MIEIIGGPDRDRTDDLFHAMEARSQLRHRPTFPTLPLSLRRSSSSIASRHVVAALRLIRLADGRIQLGDTSMGWIKT
jgi:hypothetical protein